MQLINKALVQEQLDRYANEDLYLHMELTMGAYAAHNDSSKHPASNFIKNIPVRYSRGTIEGDTYYRVGLKINDGWVYTEGLTHWEENEEGRVLLAGHDAEGRLIVSLLLSRTLF
ncbi:YojF family protein [Paenibacillus gallinarum]|uniref:YojF family protein n=1 Tax=Paenibacillus gallinarum TaxID=2762232 RepID=A0ABR8SYB2_9BACL|nr:YojF family protein [Paenibacillus gallinarum]MBD7968329.1 YojF family protein [Paenibacillus gallinarum]